MAQHFPIFVSSLCKDLWDLRERIYFVVGKEKYVYVDEHATSRHLPILDQLAVADDLIARVRESDVFVCVLGGSNGSQISIDGVDSSVSFFEIELYQAALLGKPIHLFVRDDFAPEPRLEELLRILYFAFPGLKSAPRLSDREIETEIRKLVSREKIRRAVVPLPALRRPINRLVQALYAIRARHLPDPSVHFLHNTVATVKKVPDERIIRSVLASLETLKDEEKRLSRIWIGMRELLYAHYRHTTDPDLLNYWDLLLREWARAGAWYGLHGDMPLGCLAGLNSVAVIRNRVASLRFDAPHRGDTEYPGGALASAKYSIAKRLYIKADRFSRLTEARDDVERMLTGKPDDQTGLLAIRGSIYRQLGKYAEATTDYENVLALRKANKAAVPAIGDAMSELAFGYLLQRQLRRALEYSEEGIALLRAGDTVGFLARGLRKQAIIYLANGRLLKAYDAWSESRTVAQSSGSYDQL